MWWPRVIETESQLDMLKTMMCDEMQGFLLGKPLDADDFGNLLRGKNGKAV